MEWVKELLSVRRWMVLLHSQLLGSAVLADWQGFWGELSQDASACWFFSLRFLFLVDFSRLTHTTVTPTAASSQGPISVQLLNYGKVLPVVL